MFKTLFLALLCWMTPAHALDITGPELDALLLNAYKAETGFTVLPEGFELEVQSVGKAEGGNGAVFLAGFRKFPFEHVYDLEYPQHFYRVYKKAGRSKKFAAEPWSPKIPNIKYALVQSTRLLDQEFDLMANELDPTAAYLVEITDPKLQTEALMGILGIRRQIDYPPLIVARHSTTENTGQNLPWLEWQAENPEFKPLTVEWRKTRRKADIVIALFDKDFKQVSGQPRWDYAQTREAIDEHPRDTGKSMIWDFYNRQFYGKIDADFKPVTQQNRLEIQFADHKESFAINRVENFGTNGYRYIVAITFENEASMRILVPNDYDPDLTPRISIDELRDEEFQQPDSPLAQWGYYENWMMMEWAQPLNLGRPRRDRNPSPIGVGKHNRITDADLEITPSKKLKHLDLNMRGSIWMKRQGDTWSSAFPGEATAQKVEFQMVITVPAKFFTPCNGLYENQNGDMIDHDQTDNDQTDND